VGINRRRKINLLCGNGEDDDEKEKEAREFNGTG